MASKSAPAKIGENIFAKNPKVSAELLALTYGAFVSKIMKDTENPEEVNA